MPVERIAKTAFYIAILVSVIMATLPHPPQIPGNPSDKLQHAAAFATIGALSALGYPRTRAPVLLFWISLIGVGIEIVQAIPALHRDSDWRDVVADVLATGVALAIVRLAKKKQSVS